MSFSLQLCFISSGLFVKVSTPTTIRAKDMVSKKETLNIAQYLEASS
jgi:hypothetical protein